MNDSTIEKFRQILKGKDLFTPKELVKLGIYGCKSSVHRAIREKHLEAIWMTSQRIVILKDSIIKHVEWMMKKE